MALVCPKSREAHSTIIQRFPNAQFCLYCGTDLQVTPIEIDDSSPSNARTRPPSQSIATHHNYRIFPSGSSQLPVRDKTQNFSNNIISTVREAAKAANQAREGTTQIKDRGLDLYTVRIRAAIYKTWRISRDDEDEDEDGSVRFKWIRTWSPSSKDSS
jgi:hypothetical protein